MSFQQLDALIEFYKTLPDKVLRSADAAMVMNSAEFVELNKSQIRDEGKDSLGHKLKFAYPRKTPVSGSYTKKYKRFKETKYGGQTSFVDWTLTGELLDSLRLDHETLGEFKIVSETNADLLDVLLRNYTPEALGLQKQNLQSFADNNIKPIIQNDIETLISRI